jgi:hypothetical protein
MNAWVKYVGIGSVALSALACGSKGEDEGDDEGTGGTSSGGTSSGGSSSGGTSTGGSSTGGSGGSGTLPPIMTWTFDDAEDVCETSADANTPNCWKLVDSNSADDSEPLPRETIDFEHVTNDGDPDEGAFQATIPYDMVSQWVSFGINFESEDLSGRTITARLKVASGFGDPTALMDSPAGSKVYAKSGAGYCYANGDYFNHGDMDHPIGTWNTIRFNLARPPQWQDTTCSEAFDPADIREIGIQFDSSPTVAPEEAVVLIDSVEF